MDPILNQYFLKYTQNESLTMSQIKQYTLNDLLKQGSEYLLAQKCEEAIPLYETALKLLNEESCPEEYDVYENDMCAIEYSLCLCYTSHKQYFDKANEEFSPLVISYGKQFPTLYYARAKLLLSQRLFQETEKCIDSGLDALLAIQAKDNFKTNWPGTDIQIPESSTDVLRKSLKNLKKLCIKQSTVPVSVNLKTATPVPVNLRSTPVPVNSKTDYNRFENFNTSSNNCERLSLCKVQSNSCQEPINDLISKESKPNVHEYQLEKLASTSVEQDLTHKSRLNVDVPEFVPKTYLSSSTPQSLKCAEIVETAITMPAQVKSGVEILKVKKVEKYCQTITVKAVDKGIEARTKAANVAVQTLCTNCSKKTCPGCTYIDVESSTSYKKLMNENKTLQKKVADLTEKLVTTKKQFNEEQCSRKELEQKLSIESIKFEVQLNDRLKSYENDIKSISSTFMVQFIRNNDIQKLILNRHVDRCKSMINSLSQARYFLTNTSTPTLKDFKRNMDHWSTELKRTQSCLKSFQNYQELVLSEFQGGNIGTLPEPPDFSIIGDEPCNILQECFHLAVGSLLKEIDRYAPMKKFHQDYYHWWISCGRFMYTQSSNVPPSSVAASTNASPGINQIPIQYQPPGQPAVATSTNAVPGINTIPLQYQVPGPSAVVANTNTPPGINPIPVQYQLAGPTPLQNSLHDYSVPYAQPPNLNNLKQGTPLYRIPPLVIKEESFANTNLSLETTLANNVPVSEDTDSKITENVLPNENVFEACHGPQPQKSFVEALEQDLKISSDQEDQNALEYLTTSDPSFETTEIIDNNMVGQIDIDFIQQEKCDDIASTISFDMNTEAFASDITGAELNSNINKPSPVHDDTTDNRDITSEQVSLCDKNDDIRDNKESISKPRSVELTEQTSASNNDLINLNQLLKKEEEVSQSETTLQALGGPKFYSLFCYVKSRIPKTSDAEVWNALSVVKQKRVKLSGMTKDKIVEEVQLELIEAMNSDETPNNKVSWAQVNDGSSTWNKNQHDTQCIICFDLLEVAETTNLRCDHKFHSECIKKWISTNCVCPICRVHATIDVDFQSS